MAKVNDLYDVDETQRVSDAESEDDPEQETNETVRPVRDDLDLYTYCPMHVTRPVLPCSGEQQMTREMYDRINSFPHRDGIFFVDAQFVCKHIACPSRGCNLQHHEVEVRPRRNAVILVTLEMGPVRINVRDWRCLRCGKQNYYSGRADGIFPARKTSAYSTDYLYCLVDLVCRLSISQRTAYETLNVVSKLTKKLLQLEFHGPDNVPLQDQVKDILKRRRVTETLTLFMQTLNYGVASSMKQLYHCTTCESFLTHADKRKLGLTAEQSHGLKRYKGVVIDWTSCGIIASLPDYHRDNFIITGPTGTGRKLSLIHI